MRIAIEIQLDDAIFHAESGERASGPETARMLRALAVMADSQPDGLVDVLDSDPDRGLFTDSGVLPLYSLDGNRVGRLRFD